MFDAKKKLIVFTIIFPSFFLTTANAEEEEIYLKSIFNLIISANSFIYLLNINIIY